ncbi:trypsin-like serine peptidase [Pseudomonas typographi]|uniref:trypsin-like serine peptidase n=1 Tax=Pseudomonas typographi TaxID=2715964 RepID=UPI001684177B|nr:serine protease [Pseudomonas typographi]MBD1589839.1 trypsin-like serine protease [Pseudomonas typographi]
MPTNNVTRNKGNYRPTFSKKINSKPGEGPTEAENRLGKARAALQKELRSVNNRELRATNARFQHNGVWQRLLELQGSPAMIKLNRRRQQIEQQIKELDAAMVDRAIGAMRIEFDEHLARVLGVSVAEIQLLSIGQKTEAFRKYASEVPEGMPQRFETFEAGFSVLVEQQRAKAPSQIQACLEFALCHVLPNALSLAQHLNVDALPNWPGSFPPGAEGAAIPVGQGPRGSGMAAQAPAATWMGVPLLAVPRADASPSVTTCDAAMELAALTQSFEALQNKTDAFIRDIGRKGHWPELAAEHPIALNLLTSLPEFPPDHAIRVFDPVGQEQARYPAIAAPQQRLHFIDLVQQANGTYTANRPAQTAQTMASANPLELILPQLRPYSALVTGGNFPGAMSPEGQQIVVHEKMAAAARQKPVAIRQEMAEAHATTLPTDFLKWLPNAGKTGRSSLVARLIEQFPHIPESRIQQVLVDHIPSAAQRNQFLYENGELPELYRALYQESANLEHQAEQAAHQDYIRHARPYDVQADATLREVANSTLASIGCELHILKPGETAPASGDTQAAVTLYDYGLGRYGDTPSEHPYIPSDAKTDSFFQAINRQLPEAQRRQLGANSEVDIVGLRRHLADAAAAREPSCAPTAVLTLPTATYDSATYSWPNDWGRGFGNYDAQATLLTNTDGQNDRFMGIGRLDNQCTAFLIKTPPTKKAVAITNAHCVDLEDGQIVTHRKEVHTIEFGAFKGSQPVFATAEQLLFANRRRHDLALLRLNVTLAQLQARGVQPLEIANKATPIGHDLVIAGYPNNGEQIDLQLSTCVRQPVGGDIWKIQRHGLQHDCLNVNPGASGSPIIDRASGEVIAVSSHVLGDESGGYGGLVTDLKGCFNGRLPKPKNCVLLPAHDMQISGDTGFRVSAQGGEAKPAQLSFSTDQRYFQYKVGTSPAACEQPGGYSVPMQAGQQDHLVEMADSASTNYACAVAQPGADGAMTKGMLHNAAIHALVPLREGETLKPHVEIADRDNGNYQLVVAQEITSPARLFSKFGPARDTDCNEPEGYHPAEAIEFVLALAEDVKHCAKAIDPDGQESSPVESLLAAAPLGPEREA